MGREHCTTLCTKQTAGECRLCDALDERDAFCRMLRGGFAIVIGRGIWWFGTQIGQVLKLWAKHFWRSITHESGYRIVIGIGATLVGVYFGLYAIVEARHERHLNRALFERSAFMTMVVTGPSGFRSAMKQFAQLQNQKAPIEPDLSLPPWKWFGAYRPNREPLRQWALNFMAQCEIETCGTHRRDVTSEMEKIGGLRRIRLEHVNLEGADLRGADLREAVLGDADLRGADLRHTILFIAYLRNADLRGADLRGADLRANLWDADLRGADLRGADLRRGAYLRNADLRGADLRDAVLGETYLGGANLRGVKNLTQEQIDASCVYNSTILPEHIKRPEKNPEGCAPESKQKR